MLQNLDSKRNLDEGIASNSVRVSWSLSERICRQGAIRLQKIATVLPGVWELRPDIFRDARGFFMESYNQAKFAAAG